MDLIQKIAVSNSPGQGHLLIIDELCGLRHAPQYGERQDGCVMLRGQAHNPAGMAGVVRQRFVDKRRDAFLDARRACDRSRCGLR